MEERYSVMTRKGQITIPADFRRRLGLSEGDKVALVLEDGEVRIARCDSVIARTAGLFKSGRPALTARELREQAEQAFADEVDERSGR